LPWQILFFSPVLFVQQKSVTGYFVFIFCQAMQDALKFSLAKPYSPEENHCLPVLFVAFRRYGRACFTGHNLAPCKTGVQIIYLTLKYFGVVRTGVYIL